MVSFCDFRGVIFLWIVLVFQHSVTTAFSVGIGAPRPSGRFQLLQQTLQPQKLSMISSGFSFDDGEQVLVSVQKPMGMVLEQEKAASKIVVKQLDQSATAARAGVQLGDVLVAVENASVEDVDLDNVMDLIQHGPRVMNLRFQRGQA